MPYDNEELEKFRLSGKILRETREEMRTQVYENMPIIDVCEKVEGLIRAKGGKPAFPCNVSINEVAAHYTSPPCDASKIPEGSTVKVDLGVQIDGYVTDTAFTVSFNSEGRSMVNTAEQALKTALENIHGGMALGKIGSLIETSIRNRGFKPISNLTGHSGAVILNPWCAKTAVEHERRKTAVARCWAVLGANRSRACAGASPRRQISRPARNR